MSVFTQGSRLLDIAQLFRYAHKCTKIAFFTLFFLCEAFPVPHLILAIPDKSLAFLYHMTLSAGMTCTFSRLAAIAALNVNRFFGDNRYQEYFTLNCNRSVFCLPRDPNLFWTSGQWMTERQGGSDVGHGTETLAVPQQVQFHSCYLYAAIIQLAATHLEAFRDIKRFYF